MKTFSTYILAINPNTGEQCKFVGQNVNAENADKAREYCDNNGLGYLFIDVEIHVKQECRLIDYLKSLIKKYVLN